MNHVNVVQYVIDAEAEDNILFLNEKKQLRAHFIAVREFELRSSLAVIEAATRILIRRPEDVGELTVHIQASLSNIRRQLNAGFPEAHRAPAAQPL